MQYESYELDQMNIRQLAALNATNAEDEQLIMEKFAQRAQTSRLDELRAVDVRFGWQEKILNPIIEERMFSMPQDNDPVLNYEDQSVLDKPDLTKEEELALQAKLDAAKAKRRGSKEVEEVQEEVIETDLVAAEVAPKKGRKKAN